MRLKPDVYRAVLVTSLVWAVLDVIIIFYFIDTSSTFEGLETFIDLILLFSRQIYGRNPRFALINESKNANQLTTKRQDEFPTDPRLVELLSNLRFDEDGPGSNGAGVVIPKDKEGEMQRKFKINQFNLMASDMVSINRTLPDYRSSSCIERGDSIDVSQLPKTSIIIVFHNEAWSTLLRSLHSIMNRSPLQAIEEIILVDDYSDPDKDYLKAPLEQYIKRFPVPMHLVHLAERSGLIRARLKGSDMAKGKVLLFLDAHVEVTKGWLEPLLERVSLDRKTVVAPIIDVISDDNFEYVTASDQTLGGFNWQLNFRWYSVSEREMKRRNNDRSSPIRTPTIAGGLFAIDRSFFYDIGSYDEGQQVWGGENLEISFRVWQCGGILEINPCSRVGHVSLSKYLRK